VEVGAGGDLFPSGNKRQDGTTPYENFVCARCQRDVRELREIERALKPCPETISTK
jgi:hypothetical protein